MLYDIKNIDIHSEVSADELNKSVDMLQPKNNLNTLGKYFIEAQNNYDINAIILLSIACLESTYGTSKLAVEKNNLFGIDARDSLQGQANYGKDFETVEECIDHAGHRLGKQYLEKDPAATWRYCGGNKDIWSVGKKWCSKSDWGDKIENLAQRIEDAILSIRASSTQENNEYKEKYEEMEEKYLALKEKLDRIKEILLEGEDE